MTQPKALYLADVLEHKATHEHGTMLEMSCAAELRRLSEIETLYLAAMRGRHAMSEELLAVTAQRDALLEALKDATKTIEHLGYPLAAIERACAAIKAAEGENT